MIKIDKTQLATDYTSYEIALSFEYNIQCICSQNVLYSHWESENHWKLIQLSVICLREAARALLFHTLASLVPRLVRALQVKRGGLERRAIFGQDWQMTSQTKITEDDWQRRCVSAADQSEAGLLQTLCSFRSAPRLLQTVAMDDFFVFQNRQLTVNTTNKKNNILPKVKRSFWHKNKFLNIKLWFCKS